MLLIICNVIPNLIEPLNTRIKEILAAGLYDTQRYVRFILNEDVLSYAEKPVKEKKSLKA
jgi:glycerol-3-phosphate responsive antiterminator